jgi:hypothetical protein
MRTTRSWSAVTSVVVTAGPPACGVSRSRATRPPGASSATTVADRPVTPPVQVHTTRSTGSARSADSGCAGP